MLYERFPYPYDDIGRKLHELWTDLVNPVRVRDWEKIYERAADSALTVEELQFLQMQARRELESTIPHPNKPLPAHAVLLYGYAQQAMRREETIQSPVNEYIFGLIGKHAPSLLPSVTMEEDIRGLYFQFAIKMRDTKGEFFTVFNPTYIDPEKMIYFQG